MRYMLFLILSYSFIYANVLYNRGEYLYFSKACSSCHGPSAEGSSSAPKLAYKSQKYLFNKLYNFKKGKVFNQSQEMMSQFVKLLDEKDIKAISIFLSQHKEKKYPDIDDDILGGVGS